MKIHQITMSLNKNLSKRKYTFLQIVCLFFKPYIPLDQIEDIVHHHDIRHGTQEPPKAPQ